MDRYVDGFVLPVANDSVDAYREMASDAGKVWIEHGALEYFEGVGDDMAPEMGEASAPTFSELADAGPDETVVFAFVVYESRAHRDEVNAKVKDDPRMNPDDADAEMPFEMDRMAYAGFSSLVSYGR
jgi:uncharacterized protein YbaA (DUF1428 family)